MVKRRDFLKSLAVGSLLSGCSPLIKSASRRPSFKNLNRVLLIGIDGLRPDALKVAKTPNLDILINNGSYGLMKADAPTWSAHGWSDLLIGVKSDKHGVTENTFSGSNYLKYPCFFTRLKETKPELNTLSVVSWKPLYDKLIKDVDISIYHPYSQLDLVTEEIINALYGYNPDAIFAYFVDIDLAGHQHGFHHSIKPYMDEITKVDYQIGRIMEAVNNRPNDENWLILITSDHGGTKGGHGGNSLEEKTVFYLASDRMGNYSRNRGRNVHHVDFVPTLFDHLKVKIKPEWALDGKNFLQY